MIPIALERRTLGPAACLLAASLLLGAPSFAQLALPDSAGPYTFDLVHPGLRAELTDPASGHRFVKVRIGDEELTMIFDTGAGANCLSKKLVARLGLVKKGSVRALGTGDAVPAGLVRLPEISIPLRGGGELRSKEIRAVELELAGLSRMIGHEVDGILGTAIFASHPFCVDLHKGRVTVFERESFVVPKGASKHALRLITGIPCARFELDGVRPRWFLLDTGNAGTLILHPALVRRLELDIELSELPYMRGHGIGGSNKVRVARIQKTRLGALRFEGLPVTLVPKARGGIFTNAAVAGNVGSGVMAYGRFFFDYEERSVWIEALSAEVVRTAPALGVQLVPGGGGLVVSATIEKSPARVAGLKKRDRIVAVGGSQVASDAAGVMRALRERVTLDADATVRVFRAKTKEQQGEELELRIRRRRWIPEIVLRERGRAGKRRE